MSNQELIEGLKGISDFLTPMVNRAKEAGRTRMIDQIRETDFNRIKIDTLIKIIYLIDSDEETQNAKTDENS